MKTKKIALSISVILIVWMGFIWSKYSFFYKNYSQEEINEIFKNEHVEAPVYDSIYVRGYQIYYLTNKKNKYTTKKEYKKPYLLLMHDSGDNSSHFIEYFKNKKLNELFHIIAPDRIGFGKTHLVPKEERRYKSSYISREDKEFGTEQDFISSVFPKRILDEEWHYIDEIRMVYNGYTSILGFQAYKNEYLSFNKMILFNPKFGDRFTISKYYSKFVNLPYVNLLFPRPYLNKHKDLLYIDDIRKNKLKSSLEFAKDIEDERNNNENMIYTKKPDGTKEYIKPRRKAKFIFLKINNENSKEDIEEYVNSKKYFVFDKIEKRDFYSSPEFVLKEILKTNNYTENYRKIK